MSRIRKTPQNPSAIAVKNAKSAWSVSISKVDAHSRRCRLCNTKVRDHKFALIVGSLTDPKCEAYQLCGTGQALYFAEVQARKDFLAIGGVLGLS